MPNQTVETVIAELLIHHKISAVPSNLAYEIGGLVLSV